MRRQPTSHARQQIVRAIHRDGPISRVEIAAQTGLSGPTIGEVGTNLLTRGLVREVPDAREARSRGRGRPRVLLQIDPGGAIILAGSLSWQGILEVAFVNLAGTLLHGISLPVSVHESVDSLTAELSLLLRRSIDDSPFATAQIARIALALPGVVDSRLGLVHWLPTLAPATDAVAATLQARLGVAVTIENDLESLARARYWFAKDPTPGDFMLLYVGATIGAAHYANDAPRVTRSGISEFGHVKTDFSATARPCVCGGRGCVAAYSSMVGMLDQTEQWAIDRADFGRFYERFDALMAAANAGDAAATAVFEQAGRHLGIALAAQITANDPGHVILQTSVAGLSDLLAPSLRRSLADHALPIAVERTSFHTERAPVDWRWQGAAALALEQIYADA